MTRRAKTAGRRLRTTGRVAAQLIGAAYVALATYLIAQEWRHGAAAQERALEAVRSASYAADEQSYRAAMEHLAAVAPDRAALQRAVDLIKGRFVERNPAAAAQQLRRLADPHSKTGLKAMHELGALLVAGDGVTRDVEQGLSLLRAAADAGENRAAGTLGVLYAEGVHLPRDMRLAEHYLVKGARSDAESALSLARLYEAQRLRPPNSRAAQDYAAFGLSLLEKEAARGKVSARLQLAEYYETGTFLPRDLGRARHWYEQAIEAGSDAAVVRLALMLRDVDGSEQARKRAAALLDHAAARGSGQALIELAYGYRQGLGGAPDHAKAVELFRAAADRGLSGGMVGLGTAYMQGEGLPQDYELGMQWLRRAAERGSAGAKYQIGLAYRNGTGVPKDDALAYEWFMRAARSGSISGMAAVSRLLEEGTGVPADAREALVWAERALRAGSRSTDMLVKVGRAYLGGESDENAVLAADSSKALYWLKQAAERGHSDAMIMVGRLLAYRGESAEAIEWFQRAERLGEPKALMALGRVYASGFGVPVDERKAFQYFHRASHLGAPAAMREVANAYAVGFGVPESPVVALEWYRRAAELGDARSMMSLFYCYESGLGAERDPAEAMRWLRRAADGGDPGAQYRLGVAYATGSGLRADREAAREYLQRASLNNFSPAREAMKTLFEAAPELPPLDPDEAE